VTAKDRTVKCTIVSNSLRYIITTHNLILLRF